MIHKSKVQALIEECNQKVTKEYEKLLDNLIDNKGIGPHCIDIDDDASSVVLITLKTTYESGGWVVSIVQGEQTKRAFKIE